MLVVVVLIRKQLRVGKGRGREEIVQGCDMNSLGGIQRPMAGIDKEEEVGGERGQVATGARGNGQRRGNQPLILYISIPKSVQTGPQHERESKAQRGHHGGQGWSLVDERKEEGKNKKMRHSLP